MWYSPTGGIPESGKSVSAGVCECVCTHVCVGAWVWGSGVAGVCVPPLLQELRLVSPREPVEAGMVHCGFESLGGGLSMNDNLWPVEMHMQNQEAPPSSLQRA